MSDYKHKDMSGSLFRNKEKKSDKSPDYTGTVNIHGEVLRVAGWIKGSPPFLSLAFQIPRNETGAQKPAPVSNTSDDFQDDESIPF